MWYIYNMIDKKNNNEVDVKYPFRYKLPDQELVDYAIKYKNVPYASKGMTFIMFALVKVSDIISDFKNPAREKVMVQTDIDDIEQVIEDGHYSGEGYVPPVINEKGVLQAGHHRKEGHVGANKEYMWCAICRFDNLQAELDYNLLENQIKDTFAKKMLTNEGCQSSLLNMWNTVPNFNQSDLEDRVKKLQKSPSDKRIILENCLKKMGKKIDAHRPLSEIQIKNEFSALTDGKMLDTTAALAIGDNIWNNSRLLSLAVNKLMEGQDVSMSIKVNHTTDLEQLKKERTRIKKEVSLDYLYNFCKDIVTKYEDKKIKKGKLTLNFPRQYESDAWEIGVETDVS